MNVREHDSNKPRKRLYVVIDYRTKNILGEFESQAEARKLYEELGDPNVKIVRVA